MDDDDLIAHLPIDRAHAVAAATGSAAVDGRRSGAVLFADIAGFTPMSRRLTERLGTRAGTEELTRRLNAVYNRVVDAVHDHGGAIVEFSGDAVMCWFDDAFPDAAGGLRGTTPPVAGAWRAAACGLRLQEVVALGQDAFGTGGLDTGGFDAGGFDAGGRPAEESLALRVTVASGPVVRAVVGDPEVRRIDVLAGAPVVRVATMVADPGDVVLDDATVTALAAARPQVTDGPAAGTWRLSSIDAPRPAPWAPAPSGARAEARTWTDHRLRDRALPLTELRPTVSVFVRFSGFDDPADTHFATRLDAYVRHVQARAALDDGNLLQVSMGEKGDYLYLSFGAPIARDDLADRAVRTALDLASGHEPAGVGPTAVGVAQGISRTGTYGGRARATYGALGDATNLAARLMAGCASGEVAVADPVVRACVGGIVFEPVGAMRFKGFDDDVVVSRATGRRALGAAGRRFATSLVGRVDELRRLVDLLGVVDHAGDGCVVVVEGEAGIGKSRLVDAARERLLADHSLTWLSSGAVDGTAAPLQPFLVLLREMLFLDLAEDSQRRALFDLGVDGVVDDLRAAGLDDVAAEVETARPFLGALLGVRWEGSAFERSDPAARFERSLRAVATFLRAEARRRPLVLHLRDVHWLDADSRRLVERLARATAEVPMALVLDRRPGEDAGSWSVGRTETLGLRALDGDGIRHQADLLLGGPCGDRLFAALVRRAAGNPFFTEQLLLDLQERDLVQWERGGFDLADDADVDLPLNLHATLLSRLDRLPEALRDLVQAAAVLGERFDIALLAAVASPTVHEAGFTELLERGERAGIWTMLDGGTVGFTHALLRDAAYAMQPDLRLRLRHRATAGALGLLAGTDPDRWAEIAEHHARAGQHWHAAVYLRRAARRAGGDHAHRQGVAEVERALELLSGRAGSRTTARLAELAGDLGLAAGDAAVAARHYAASAAVVDGDASRVLRCLTGLGDAQERLGRTEDATAAYERALVDMGGTGELGLAGRIYAGLSRGHLRAGDLEAGIELGELALALAPAGGPADLGRAHTTLACLHLARHDLGPALQHAQAAMDAGQEAGDPLGLAAAANTLGLVSLERDDLDEACSRFRDAHGFFRVAGNEAGEARALDNLAQALMRCGRSDDAMVHLTEAVEILSRIGLDEDGIHPALWQSGVW